MFKLVHLSAVLKLFSSVKSFTLTFYESIEIFIQFIDRFIIGTLFFHFSFFASRSLYLQDIHTYIRTPIGSPEMKILPSSEKYITLDRMFVLRSLQLMYFVESLSGCIVLKSMTTLANTYIETRDFP